MFPPQAAPAQTPPPTPRSEALARMMSAGKDPMMSNPASGPAGSDGPEFFLEKDMFPDGCKQGDTVQITGLVGAMGAKVAVTPISVKPGGGPAGDPSAEAEETPGEETNEQKNPAIGKGSDYE